jgi:redox-sensitive bicupin YhaK (pirin superfamily)
MITIRRAADRGHFDHGWLNTYHTFSFADYHDPGHMGFRSLRVVNDDRVAPGQGFGAHRHRDMEIVSYVLEGALAHKDSLGNSGVIRPGDVQRMSAGTGVEHAEFNGSKTEPVHFLQIWILPDQQGLPPAYGQQPIDREAARRGFTLLASKEGRDGSLQVSQDVDLWLSLVEPGERRELKLRPGRHAWVHVARGAVALEGTALEEGDGVAVSGAETLALGGRDGGEVLLFDLA